MSDFAQLIMSGRLGRDPELRETPNGHKVVTFSVAATRRAGEGREFTFWATVEAWGRLAEILADNFSKGNPIVFTARPRTDSWEDKESGQKRTRDIYTMDQLLSYGSGKGSDKEQDMPY